MKKVTITKLVFGLFVALNIFASQAHARRAYVDERMEVLGVKYGPLDPGHNLGDAINFGGGGGGSGNGGEKGYIDGGEKISVPTTPSNAELARLAIVQVGSMINSLRDVQAYAYLKVTVTTPEGLKVEVELELGYGRVNVKSKRAL